MNIYAEIAGEDEQWLVATLAISFAHLAMAPWDAWGHEGSPAEMAVFVVKQAKERGQLGMLIDTLGPRPNQRHWAKNSGLSMKDRDTYYEQGRQAGLQEATLNKAREENGD